MTLLRGAGITVAAMLALAGCAGTNTDSASTPGLVNNGLVSVSRPSTPDSLAQHLLEAARVPAGAVRSATPPVPSLRRPPELPVMTGLVIRSRWWRIDEPLAATYSWISHHQSAALSSLGGSSTGGPSLSDVQEDADFAPPHLPGTVNSAQLSIAVVPITARISAIGAFSVVVRQPARSQTEDVPSSVDSVTVVTRRTTGQPGTGPVIDRVTVTGSSARRLVGEFDALSVQPPGEQFSCPMSLTTETAIFRAGTHVWDATAGVCVGIHVTLDGHPLPTLDTSDSFSRDLRAALGRRSVAVVEPVDPPIAQTSTANP
jgi:hypothetical protein